MAKSDGLKFNVIIGERSEKRPCIVRVKGEDKKALFHCWEHVSKLVDASPMVGGHPGGTVSGTLAVVEFEDGSVDDVYLSQIKFLDTECEMADLVGFAMYDEEKERAADGD